MTDSKAAQLNDDRYVRGMERLIGVVQQLSRARSLPEIQEIVRTAARQLTGADGATFVLRDGDKCHYADEDAIAPLWKGMRFPMATCISGWAMLNGRAAVIEDIYADPRIPADAYRPTFVKSLVMVPIRAPDAIGAIGNYWATRRQPTDAEVALLRALADSTAIAMENVRVSEALAEKERQLLQAQKMEAVGRLASGIAHDFNNVLSVVLTCAQLSLEDLAGDPCAADLEEILTAGRRGAELTRQLLGFSRQQPLQPRIVDVGRIVAGMDGMLRRLVGADIELAVSSSSRLWTTRADPGHVEQVVMNLAINARDAMTDVRRLTIETRNTRISADDEWAARGVEPGEYVVLSVSDTGSGMDEATRARIFEPFFTTKGEGRGTGLGLATVLGIVEQNGGHVTVDSALGQGTTFRVWLPRVDASREVDEPPAQSSDVPVRVPIAPETILLVDDDPSVRAAERAALRRRGYVVLEAASAGDALLVAEEHPGPVHLLLTAFRLRRVGGPQLAERLAKTRPEMRVLYTCASGGDCDPLPAGARLLMKPITSDALSSKVREVLDAAG